MPEGEPRSVPIVLGGRKPSQAAPAAAALKSSTIQDSRTF